ncbi:polyketide synthase dehydratase domain-containing protein, partial [Actinomadura sp. CNU-125]|uniref:polyketide synthase dehydratase domain-containing protein n=1 Tax=Actinomadura sp. CNU-125 TaxID=1904961 RepID=UPI000AE1AC90
GRPRARARRPRRPVRALAARGHGYGPAFRGLRAAWLRGGEVFAEVALPDDLDTGGYGVHPALLDAALHPIALGLFGERDGALLPFAWSGVRLHSSNARVLRVRLTRAGGDGSATDAVALDAADTAGRPVLSVASLAVRPVDPRALARSSGGGDLYRVEWRPSAPVPGPRPRVRLLGDEGEPGDAAPDAFVAPMARAGPERALELALDWLADERRAGRLLVFATEGATAVRPGDDADPDQAAIWGWCGSRRASTRAGSRWPTWTARRTRPASPPTSPPRTAPTRNSPYAARPPSRRY